MTTHMRARLVWQLWIGCVGCALVTPLDSVKPGDAGTVKRPVSEPSGNAGKPAEAKRCPITSGADCNPALGCGCPDGKRCTLDEPSGRVACLSSSAGALKEGSVCGSTSECAAGLECNGSNLCMPYCQSDDDCDGRGKCLAFINVRNNVEVPGAQACSRWCDPLSGEPCAAGSGCVATGAMSRDTRAACRGNKVAGSGEGKAIGKKCDSIFECANGLGCAEYGPRVCTPFCYSDNDCPDSAEHCYFSDLISAPDKPIGQCIVWPCDDSTVPAPKGWTEGPVWTADQFETCKKRCGPSSDCWRTTCDDSERWGGCVDAGLLSCAAAPQGPCRQDYVKATCCSALECEPYEARLLECARAQTTCVMQAERACWK